MADNSSSPATPQKAPGTRQLVAVDDLKALQTVEDVLAAAQVEGRAARFVNERDFAATFFSTVGARATTARQHATAITTGMTRQKTATTNEAKFKKALAQAVGAIQSGASQKLQVANPQRLPLYGIGGDVLRMNRSELTQFIPTLLTAAGDDAPLPGVGATQIAAVQSAFQSWKDADAEQTAAANAISRAHTALTKLLYGDPDDATAPALDDDRRTIQYAADGLWPPGTDPATRREFKLPPDKRFSAKPKPR